MVSDAINQLKLQHHEMDTLYLLLCSLLCPREMPMEHILGCRACIKGAKCGSNTQ